MSEYGNGYDSNNMMGSTNFNDLINSYDYKSSRNKIFKPQNQEFRWKELMRLNPEYIRKTNDLTTLEPYVENILHSNLKNEDYQNLPGEYIAQLISLLQITNEYLMYSQQKLEKENDNLKKQMNEYNQIKEQNKKYEKIIKDYKRGNKEKDEILKTYQVIVKNGQNYH
jgi:hypothetical protein